MEVTDPMSDPRPYLPLHVKLDRKKMVDELVDAGLSTGHAWLAIDVVSAAHHEVFELVREQQGAVDHALGLPHRIGSAILGIQDPAHDLDEPGENTFGRAIGLAASTARSFTPGKMPEGMRRMFDLIPDSWTDDPDLIAYLP